MHLGIFVTCELRCHSPRGAIRPHLQGGGGPGGGFIRVADIAGIRDLQRVAHGRADKAEGVAADVHIAEGLGDLRHVAGDTVAARAVGLVMRVFRDGGRVRSVG